MTHFEERELEEIEDCARKGIAFPAGAVRMVAEIRRLSRELEAARFARRTWQEQAEASRERIAKLEWAARRIRDVYPKEARGSYFDDLCEVLG